MADLPMPELDMPLEEEGMPEDLAMGDDALGELDPQFAADLSEAFPDLDDAQITAVQRAVMGLIGK